LQNTLAGGGEPLEEPRGVLVPAMLGPEEREDGKLEVVRRALQQRADTVELPVGQAETAVERFRDGAQGASVSGAAVGQPRRMAA